jgi:TRAP-type C4-dicarboxylate transport system substrate-binding protein
VITLGVFFLPGVKSTQAAPIELRYANLFPPVHIHSKVVEAWGKEIEKRTGGKVKFTYYHGGTLLKGAKIYDSFPRFRPLTFHWPIPAEKWPLV